MRINLKVLIMFMSAVICLTNCSFVGKSRAEDYIWDYRSRLEYADLVVRGVISDFHTEVAKHQEFVPDTRHPDAPLPVTVLNLQVIDILRGVWDESTLQVIVPGGYPDGVRNDTGVIVELFGHTYNYAIGDEVILTLWYLETMRGGSYVVVSDEGRYIRSENGFVNQADKQLVLSMPDIEEIVSETNIMNIYNNADVVAMGTVVDISRETVPRVVEEHKIVLRVDDVWKGADNMETIVFDMIVHGGYSSSKKKPVPKIKKEEQWLVFLKRDDEGLYPLAGANGLLRIEGSTVIRNNRVIEKLSKKEIFDFIVKESSNEN